MTGEQFITVSGKSGNQNMDFLHGLMSSRSKASRAQAYNKHKTGVHKWDCHCSSCTESKKVFEEVDLN